MTDSETRILKSPHVTSEVIDWVKNVIVEKFHPEKIILFGSWAKGTAREDSDLDVLAVVDGDIPSLDMASQINLCFWGRKFRMDLLARKPLEIDLALRDHHPFYSEIFRTGRVIYGS